jgi:hypothetical protein
MTQLKVQDVACTLILRNPSKSAIELAELVKQQLPSCNCSASSIAWYKNKLKKGEIKGFSPPANPTYFTVSREKANALRWPEWNLPNNQELLQLAKITIPYICFLHPDIVRFIVADNQLHREKWHARLAEHGVDPSLYLWEGSPCAFPGVRRYAGGAEIAQHRNKMTRTARPDNAIALDDNSYPKQIWSFVFLGKRFPNQGPSGYSLAHLVDHKNYKNRGQEEIANNRGDEVSELTLFGLYTSVTNSVYMPNGLIRPTDFSFLLRNLIQRKADAIYGNFCKLLPPHLSFRTNDSDAWSLDAFDWREPVGTSDHVQAFLRYRNEKMEKLFEATKVTAAEQSPKTPPPRRGLFARLLRT